MVVANYREWSYMKILKMMVMATFFAQLQNSNTFFQEFDDDDDYENLSGDASIIWHNWLYQGHLLKDDEQEPLQEERH